MNFNKENFYLYSEDNTKKFITDLEGAPEAKNWLLIAFKLVDNRKVPIAYIIKDNGPLNTYIQTVEDNFQNYIVSEEDFNNFIYLVDLAFDTLKERD